MTQPLSVKVKLTGTGDTTFIPEKKTPLSSGMDLKARVEKELIIGPFERVLVPTGISVAVPPGYECQVRPRSGLAVNYGITILNSPGTVDPDYRGEIKVILINLGSDDFTVRRGDRIAQMVFAKTADAVLELVSELDNTKRGEGGFGSTGR